MSMFLIDLNVLDNLFGFVKGPTLDEIILSISYNASVFFILFLLTISLMYVSLNKLFK